MLMSLHQVIHIHLTSDKEAIALIFVPPLLSAHTSYAQPSTKFLFRHSLRDFLSNFKLTVYIFWIVLNNRTPLYGS